MYGFIAKNRLASVNELRIFISIKINTIRQRLRRFFETGSPISQTLEPQSNIGLIRIMLLCFVHCTTLVDFKVSRMKNRVVYRILRLYIHVPYFRFISDSYVRLLTFIRIHFPEVGISHTLYIIVNLLYSRIAFDSMIMALITFC